MMKETGRAIHYRASTLWFRPPPEPVSANEAIRAATAAAGLMSCFPNGAMGRPQLAVEQAGVEVGQNTAPGPPAPARHPREHVRASALRFARWAG